MIKDLVNNNNSEDKSQNLKNNRRFSKESSTMLHNLINSVRSNKLSREERIRNVFQVDAKIGNDIDN